MREVQRNACYVHQKVVKSKGKEKEGVKRV